MGSATFLLVLDACCCFARTTHWHGGLKPVSQPPPAAAALKTSAQGTELLAAAPPSAPTAPAGGGAAAADPATLDALCHLLRLLERAARDGRRVPWVLIELVRAGWRQRGAQGRWRSRGALCLPPSP